MKHENMAILNKNHDKNTVLNKLDVRNINDLSEILTREYLMTNISRESIALKTFISDLEQRIISFTLSLTNGNQKIASRILGVKETSLCEKIKKYNLKKEKKKISLNLELLDMGEDEISPDLFS